jgi:hypothetical protein
MDRYSTYRRVWEQLGGSGVLLSPSLFRLVLTRSRCPQLPKANHFLAYLALLAGPEALSHPVTAQNSQGRGRSPTLRPPQRPDAAPRRGDAPPPKPKTKLRLRRKIEGNRSPRRTALKIPQKKCHVLIPCRCASPDMAVVVTDPACSLVLASAFCCCCCRLSTLSERAREGACTVCYYVSSSLGGCWFCVSCIDYVSTRAIWCVVAKQFPLIAGSLRRSPPSQ